MIGQGMNRPPTIEIRPGYQFNVMVTEDLVFPRSLQGLNVHKSYTDACAIVHEMYTKPIRRRTAMGVLKRKEEPTETHHVARPGFGEGGDRSAARAHQRGGLRSERDYLRIDRSADAADARRDGCVGREVRRERPFSKTCESEWTCAFRSDACGRCC